jgi:predicted MPP superfamily phosphohydrolase
MRADELGATLGLWMWWGGWVAWPLLGWALWRLKRGPQWWRRVAAGLAALPLLVFIDMRFVEPSMLTVRETTLTVGTSARIALISDLHLGRFKGPGYLQRVVDRLNAMPLDAVLIAGDFHGVEDGRPFTELLAPLKELRHPLYTVTGNHDEKPPGAESVAPELNAALRGLGAHVMQGAWTRLPSFTLVGLGDYAAGQDGLQPLLAAPHDRPIVLLMHNPDSAMQLKPGMAALALAGHTHGGQMRIPGYYRRVIPCNFPFDRGLHTFAPVPVFVTSGLGETLWPLRFLNPPVIDVLQFR